MYNKVVNQIGIFAGTFDPIHKGHIAFGLASAKVRNLDKVYLLPEKYPRSKQAVTAIDKRMSAIKNAVEPHPKLEVLLVDDDQFTVGKTLGKLKEHFPGAQLSLLIGSDVACESLRYWDQLDTLLASMALIVGVRSTHTRVEVETAMQELTATYGQFKYTIIDSPHANVSSSQIRISNANQSNLQPLA